MNYTFLKKMEDNLNINFLHIITRDFTVANPLELINRVLYKISNERMTSLFEKLTSILNSLGYNHYHKVPVIVFKDNNNMDKYIVSGHLITDSTIYTKPIHIDEIFKKHPDKKQQYLNLIYSIKNNSDNSLKFNENCTNFLIWNNVSAIESVFIICLILVQYYNINNILDIKSFNSYNSISLTNCLEIIKKFFEENKYTEQEYEKIREYLSTDYNWVKYLDNMIIDSIFK